MALPYFFMERISESDARLTLEEDTSRHVAQVLRMEVGEKLQLTDGNGNLHTAEIIQVHKKSTSVKILSGDYNPPSQRHIIIAISLIKNVSRFEWFLEKATEIGVNEIIPLICERTEKHHFRFDRMKGILVSAMLQSKQSWLPTLSEPISLIANISGFNFKQKFIAHCLDSDKRFLKDVLNKETDALILIGPEGDFTQNEIDLALQQNFLPVGLGETRLRTETAGIVAATLLKNCF
jgi:16S rRNA (uracil1498-N3)-methyltransferase